MRNYGLSFEDFTSDYMSVIGMLFSMFGLMMRVSWIEYFVPFSVAETSRVLITMFHCCWFTDEVVRLDCYLLLLHRICFIQSSG